MLVNPLRQPNTKTTTADFLRELQPVVVMGRGHSGTRLLAWALFKSGIQLWSDQNRASGDTNSLFNRKIKRLAAADPLATATGIVKPRQLRRFQKAALRYYEDLQRPQELWGWKFPETYLIAPYVQQTFPKARYIHIVRDGRDLAYKFHLTDDPRRRVGRRILQQLDALSSPHTIQAALSWKFQVDAFDRFKLQLPASQWIELRFEDLCREPKSSMQKTWDFLDIKASQDCLIYLESQINPAKVAQHASENPTELAGIQARIGNTLQRHGYRLL